MRPRASKAIGPMLSRAICAEGLRLCRQGRLIPREVLRLQGPPRVSPLRSLLHLARTGRSGYSTCPISSDQCNQKFLRLPIYLTLLRRPRLPCFEKPVGLKRSSQTAFGRTRMQCSPRQASTSGKRVPKSPRSAQQSFRKVPPRASTRTWLLAPRRARRALAFRRRGSRHRPRSAWACHQATTGWPYPGPPQELSSHAGSAFWT
mmetsp:Transcript_21144/g.47700  ORF Transcript_21144/g.47700 Transcript_21144/m.47700 type:complete len:204 (-) Transcript_21144:1406-2017(-)